MDEFPPFEIYKIQEDVDIVYVSFSSAEVQDDTA